MNSMAWCSVRKGDDYFLDAWTPLQQAFQKSNAAMECNPLSMGINTQYGCAALMKTLPKGFGVTWNQAQYVVSAPGAWAQVANNDFCVKTMVTKAFWNDPSGAFMTGVTALVGMLALFF